jgi:hypothetical protein
MRGGLTPAQAQARILNSAADRKTSDSVVTVHGGPRDRVAAVLRTLESEIKMINEQRRSLGTIAWSDTTREQRQNLYYAARDLTAAARVLADSINDINYTTEHPQ